MAGVISRTAEFTLPSGARARLAVPGTGDPVADELLGGSYELPAAHAMVLDLLPPGGLLLDVGAHLGTLTVPAAIGGATVVAVEANPVNADLLRSSTTALAVTVVEAAAGATTGRLTFLPDGPFGRVTRRRRGTISVEVVTATELLPILTRPPDVVKIDVEGFEVEALAGLAPLLAGHPPLVFESNAYALALRGIDVADLTRAVEQLGYDIYRIDGPDLLVPAGAGAFQARSWIDCLGVAAGTPTTELEPIRVGLRPGVEDVVADVVVQSRDPNAPVRAWLARSLAGAPAAVQADERVVEALARLAGDPDGAVRRAARRSRRR